MRSVVFVAVFFLWSSAALFPETKGAVQQASKPVPAAQAPKQQTAQQTAKPVATAPRIAKAAPQPAAEAKPKVEAVAKDVAAANVAAANVAMDKQKAEQEKLDKAYEVVQEWFRRWNALDDGSEESISRFVDLYRPDAVHLTSPRENQIGPVYYEGKDLLRALAVSTSKAYSRMRFYIKVRTVNNDTSDLMAAMPMKNGGVRIAVEFSGSIEARENKKRVTAPGVAFFDIQDGKVSRLRIYYAEGEAFPVSGSLTLGL